MAYGEGRSLLYAEKGKEEARERSLFETELSTAEDLRTEQSKDMATANLWGKLAYFFGPVPGFIAENVLPLAVDWWQDDPEKAFVSEDVGRFGLSNKYNLRNVNDALREADREQNWQNIANIGTSALTAWTMGGGSFDDPRNFDPWTYGGKEGAKRHGTGVFGKGGIGDTKKSLFDLYFG